MVVFVDQQSAMYALKSIRKIRLDKERREIKWMPEEMPKLGLERRSKCSRQNHMRTSKIIRLKTSFYFYILNAVQTLFLLVLMLSKRIPETCRTHLSTSCHYTSRRRYPPLCLCSL